MLEKKIERYLKDEVERLGGECVKLQIPKWPDRLCLFPQGLIVLVETKRPDAVPRDDQLRKHKRIRGLGFDVRVIDRKALVDLFIEEMKALIALKEQINA